MRRPLVAALAAAFVTALTLAGCTTGSIAIADAFRLVRPKQNNVDGAALRPDFHYLRLTTAGRVVLLVLGYVEPSAQGPTEVWYSATGEVLKIRGGRIVGTAGLATDWRAVRLPALPQWKDLSASPVQYRRERDEMPGYRYGIIETISLRAIAVPDRVTLIGIAPASLRWFEERVVEGDKTALVLPPARFAAESRDAGDAIIYAEQCLASGLCISWQRWPPERGSS